MGKVNLTSATFKPRVGGGFVEFFKGQSGDDIKIRVLEKDFEHNYQHWHQTSHRYVICCLTDGKYNSCPACDNPDEFSGVSDSYKVNIYNYETKKVEVWSFTNEVYLQLQKIISLAKKTGLGGSITDFDLVISFTSRKNGRGLFQNVNKCDGKTKMPDKIYEKLLKKLVDVSKFIKVLSPQDLGNKFGLNEISEEYDEYDFINDDEPEEKPKKKKAKSKKSKPEPEEDDEDFDFDDEDFDFEDDEDEPEEVEEKPKKKKVGKKPSKKKSKPEPDDDDEDDDEFDFDDDDFDF